jgi:receptor protein-tyrosine kinase
VNQGRDKALQKPGEADLLVLNSGKMPPNPSELLGSTKMAELIAGLKEWADWVIVDSPPLLAVADAAASARWADGVLMVSRGGISTRQAAKAGREMLEKVGARIAGVAVWGLEEGPAGGGYGYYYDGYHGSYYYHGYYSQQPVDGRRSSKGQSAEPDSGAKGPAGSAAAAVPKSALEAPIQLYIPEKSTGRKVAEGIGRAMRIVLAIIVILAIVAVVVYLLDGYLGWGLVHTLVSMAGQV